MPGKKCKRNDGWKYAYLGKSSKKKATKKAKKKRKSLASIERY